MDRKKVFAGIKPLFGKFDQDQVDGITAVLDEWERRQLKDLRWLAYMLATDQHETSATMQAVREAFWQDEAWRKRNLRYWPWYGRGLVQLTWRENYERADRELGLGGKLISDPDLALDLRVAVPIMFRGMIEGWFGGDKRGRHTLARYFDADTEDWIGARRIINGTDRAEKIAAKAVKYHAALKAAV
ncbi:MAG: hypothetical protein IT548_02470 [Alphaproteobacteria bacterium]|nr:hypothetical protein [Alphaproteobacteria bacterium]